MTGMLMQRDLNNSVDTMEQIDFPASGRPSYMPRTCTVHVGDVDFAVSDKNAGLVSKLHCAS